MKHLEHIVDIGTLHEMVDILTPSSSFNEYHEEEIAYHHYVRAMGAFDFRTTGDESIQTDQITAHQTARLTIRFVPGLTHKHRIVRMQDMTDWDIDLITDDGRQRFHFLTLKRAL